jgi:hypothetical protein
MELPQAVDRLAHDPEEDIIELLSGMHFVVLAGVHQNEEESRCLCVAPACRKEPVFPPQGRGGMAFLAAPLSGLGCVIE